MDATPIVEKMTYLANVTTPGSLLLQGGRHQDDRHRWPAPALRIQYDPEIKSIVVYLILFLTEGCAEQVRRTATTKAQRRVE